MNGTSKWKNATTSTHANGQRTQPVHAMNNVTSAAMTKDALNQRRRDEGLKASSTDSAAVATTGVMAPTPIARTTASRNGFNGYLDVDPGVTGATTSYDAGQQTSSAAGTNSTGDTKQSGGGGGILARGQRLLKHLARLNENDRTGK